MLTALIGGAALAIAFVVWGFRAKEPMLPMRLFGSRAFSSGNAANFLLSASLFSSVFFMAQFQQVALGQGPLDAGLRLLPWTATVFWVAPPAGKLVDRIGERPFIVAGLALQAMGMAWIALIAKTGLDYATMVAPMMIAGAGVSMAIPAAQSAIVGAVPPMFIGKASGTAATGRQLGGAFGLAVGVAVFAGAGSYLSPAAYTDGFAPALAVAAALSFAGSVAGLAIPRRTGVIGAAAPIGVASAEGGAR